MFLYKLLDKGVTISKASEPLLQVFLGRRVTTRRHTSVADDIVSETEGAVRRRQALGADLVKGISR